MFVFIDVHNNSVSHASGWYVIGYYVFLCIGHLQLFQIQYVVRESLTILFILKRGFSLVFSVQSILKEVTLCNLC